MKTITQQMVTDSLNIAIDENGYDEMLTWTPERIADELCDYDADFEHAKPGDLIPFIVNYLETRL